ncbi:MAG: 3-phosphoshikimate 1-carboxyvinyltransferase [Candidatus Izemoplasma sp.]
MSLNSTIKLFPSTLNGEVSAPPSKSISHRAIIAASLSYGKSVISNLLFSDDVNATIESMKELGVKFTKEADKLTIVGPKHLKYSHNEVNCNESGSTLRFLIPIFSLTNEKITFTGKDSLIKRPQTIYEDIFKSDGNILDITKSKIVVNGSIKARKYFIDGKVSSQFISGLMFSLPLLKSDSEIIFTSPIESIGYIDLTIDVLKSFGVIIKRLDNGYLIRGNQHYTPQDYTIDGDYSQSAFFLVGGLISERIKINNLSTTSLQGDKEIISYIHSMNGNLKSMVNGFITRNSDTEGITIDISQTPDLAPPIALLAALSKGTTKIVNASRLRIKESDRIKSIVQTLKKLGADIKEVDDSIIIQGIPMFEGGVTVDSFNDHRIAMMVSIASSRSKNEIILTQANAVSKSYPTFYDDFKSIGGNYIIVKD